jgi:dolichyl-phosphate-mannose-protein mannosyltransferase
MHAQRLSRLDAALMLLLAALTLAATITVAVRVTERIPHLEDEIAYIFQAQIFARGELWAPLPPTPTGFFTPFVVSLEDHRRVGKYPIGWPLVLAIGELVNAGWLVNPILAAITIVLIYLLGRDLYDRQVGLVAAIIALSSPLFLLQSATFMSHPAAALWATVLAYAFLRADLARESGGNPRVWTALCGAAIGLLAITRPLTAVAITLPFAVVLLIRIVSRPRQIGEMIKAYWPLALVGLITFAIQPIYTYITTGDPTTNLYLKVWTYDRVGFGPGYGRGEEGHTIEKALRTARNGIILLSSDLFGWRSLSWVPLIPGLAAGVITAKPNQRWWPVLLLLPTILLVVVHMAYWVGASVYGPRYYYEGHAGVSLLAALGITGTVRLLMHGIKRMVKSAHSFLSFQMDHGLLAWDNWPVYSVLGLLLAVNLASYLPARMAEWHGLYDITLKPVEQLRLIQQTDRVLILIRGQSWPSYAPFFAYNNPWYDGPLVAVHDNLQGRADELIALFPGREVWFYNSNTYEFSYEPTPYVAEESK